MDYQANIQVVNPPTVDDIIFPNYITYEKISYDTTHLTQEEFQTILPYLKEIISYLIEISHKSWEANVLIHIQSGTSKIDCHASTLTENNKKIISEKIAATHLNASSMEDFLENYILIRMLKENKKDVVMTLN